MEPEGAVLVKGEGAAFVQELKEISKELKELKEELAEEFKSVEQQALTIAHGGSNRK